MSHQTWLNTFCIQAVVYMWGLVGGVTGHHS